MKKQFIVVLVLCLSLISCNGFCIENPWQLSEHRVFYVKLNMAVEPILDIDKKLLRMVDTLTGLDFIALRFTRQILFLMVEVVDHALFYAALEPTIRENWKSSYEKDLPVALRHVVSQIDFCIAGIDYCLTLTTKPDVVVFLWDIRNSMDQCKTVIQSFQKKLR